MTATADDRLRIRGTGFHDLQVMLGEHQLAVVSAAVHFAHNELAAATLTLDWTDVDVSVALPDITIVTPNVWSNGKPVKAKLTGVVLPYDDGATESPLGAQS